MPGRRNRKEEEMEACHSMAHSIRGSMNNLGGPIEWGRGRIDAWRTTGERSHGMLRSWDLILSVIGTYT